MKKTKIIATIGPASASRSVLEKMIKSGVDVCRINFSHGTHEEYTTIITTIREINQLQGLHVAILSDLQGPKLRTGKIAKGEIELQEGKEIILSTVKCDGTEEKIFINYSLFPKDVKVGNAILLDDGKILLEVLTTDNLTEVKAKIIQGGMLSSNKGINLPNTKISLPCLTQKDKEDLAFALENEVEWIGLSFVRSANDIIELKKIISGHKNQAKIIAKIEKQEALKDIDNILKETDGIMVARGDLGVEIPLQNVPTLQKELVKKCKQLAKPIIIATQMMESMISNIRPTRAEVNDVANAVMDGADAVMLSGETSVGKHPVKVIDYIYSIIKEAEKHEDIYYLEQKLEINDRIITNSICDSACKLANKVNAKAIVTMTFSGYTAFKIASYRPKANIFVFTTNHTILNMLSLIWGVHVLHYNQFISTDHTIKEIKKILKNKKYLKKEDYLINITSMPIEEKGMSNMLKLSRVD